MVNWIALSAKVVGMLKSMGALLKDKPSNSRTTFKNEISNNSGTVNQLIFIAGDQTPTKKQIKDFQELISKSPHSFETLGLTEKKELIKGEVNIDKELLDFINLYIPSRDIGLWQAGLILRKHFQKGEHEIVSQIKLDMINSDPYRGKNIANLCNAGYLELEIIPIHKQLTGLQLTEDFKHYYTALVTQTPTSIFVSIQHTEKILKVELLSKIEYAKKYGAPYVKIHALGNHNVKLAKKVIDEAKKEVKFEESSFFSTEGRLDVTIDLKKQN